MDDACKHLRKLFAVGRGPVEPREAGCAECLAMGGTWVHLRLCMDCGHVGCCDDSPHRHATKHFHATQHPVIKSYEPGEGWAWCYVDEVMLDAVPSFPGETPEHHLSAP